VNGVLDEYCSITVTGSLVNAESLYFGADPLSTPSSQKWWDGQLDEIEIFRRALDDDDVWDIFIAGNSGKCPPQPCEESTGIPVCAGDCPSGLTCVAGPPPAGPCLCVPISETCEGTLQGPCGGLCPDPDDVCLGSPGNCRCETPQECGSDATCDEACPQGLVCRTTVNGCACVEEGVACADTVYPQCNGACPQGEVCRNIVNTDDCECQSEPVACADSPYPACPGACPANEECKPMPDQTCECIACGTGAPFDPSGPIVTGVPGGKIRWTPVTCALVYNLYRGVGPRLADQDTDGLADDYGGCHIGDIIGNDAEDPTNPPQGVMHWYLVTAENFAGEGALGDNGDGQPRQASSVCP
jgi:hypothetical protein